MSHRRPEESCSFLRDCPPGVFICDTVPVTSELSDPSDLGFPCASPYIELDRDQWSALASSAPLPLTQADVEKLRGLGDPIDLAEVDAVYRPLTALLEDYIATSRERAHRTCLLYTSPSPRD